MNCKEKIAPFSFNTIFGFLYANKTRRTVLATLIILVGIAVPFSLTRYGVFRYWDEPFMAINCDHYERSPIAMLTFYLGNIWMALFGETLLNLRILAHLCYISASAIGALYAYRRSGNGLYAACVFFIGSLGCNLTLLPLYGWDAAPYPFTFLTIAISLCYLQKRTAARATWLGISYALMTMSRLPMAAAILLLIPLITGIKFKNTSISDRRIRFRHLAAFILSAAIAILAIMTLAAGSPAAYFAAFAPENIIGGHSPQAILFILHRAVGLAIWALDGVAPLTSAIIAAIILSKIKNTVLGIAMCGVSVAIVLLLSRFSINALSAHGQMYLMASGLTIPLFFFVILYKPVRAVYNRFVTKANTVCVYENGLIKRQTLVLLAFCLLQALGSDSIPERIGWNTGIIFGFAIYAKDFLRDKRFTYWLFLLTAVAMLAFYAAKFRRLHLSYKDGVENTEMTTLYGLKDSYDYGIAQADSMMFVKQHLSSKGYKVHFMDIEAPTYRHALGDYTPIFDMVFNHDEDFLINQFDKLSRLGEVDVILTHHLYWPNRYDRHFTHFTNNGFTRYISFDGGLSPVFVREEILDSLPKNPFKAYGFVPLKER